MARPPSWTGSCARQAPSGPTRPSSTGSWTRATWSARRASRSWPSRPPSTTPGSASTSWIRPGHADFGGEVERSLNLVDAVLLLVDAAEGPLPQTRYVLQKAMARRLPVVVALNKIDRGDARPAEVLDDVYELFMDLGADAHQIEFPVVYTNAKAARPRETLPTPAPTSGPLLDLLVEVTPAARLRARPPAPAAGDQPVGQRLRRPDGRRTHRQRHHPRGPADHRRPRGARRHGRLDRARPHRHARPARSPACRPPTGIERIDIEEAGPGDIVSRRRAARGHDRRHPDRPRRSAAAAPPRGRRADPAHDVRRQHLAALGARGKVPHEPPAARPAWRRRSWATSRSSSSRPRRATRTRSGAGESSSWRSSSSRCGARASSSR